MRSVEKSARTVDEAVADALQELGVARDMVDIQVLEEGNKGFLGILGGKQARVRVTEKDIRASKLEAGMLFLKGLLEKLGNDASVAQIPQEDGTVLWELSGEGLGLLIGRRGQMLDAVQYLVNVVANKGEGEWVRIVLDAAGYRKRREETLQQMALRIAERVKQQQRRSALEPMNAMERRIVHMALADDEEIETFSEGDEPFRRVVVAPKRA